MKNWTCPDCLKQLRDPEQGVLDVAISSHVKQHGKTYTPVGGYRASRRSSSKRDGGVVDTIVDAIGDVVGFIFRSD